MLKKIIISILILGVLLLASLILCDITISQSAKSKTYDTIDAIPKNRVGIILGTAKKLSNGQPNAYYTYRIEATVNLFKAHKIEFVLVSGDNGSIYYNEPNTIKKDLISKGIPAEKIFLDYAGFRTLDSMVRAKHIFGLDNATVISQKFHNDRALYLAHKKGLNAIGFNAKDVDGASGLKVKLREYFARVKVFIDLMTNKQPKFFGEKIEIK